MWTRGMTRWNPPDSTVYAGPKPTDSTESQEMALEEEALLKSGEYIKKYSRRFWILLAAFFVLLCFMVVLSVFFYLSVKKDQSNYRVVTVYIKLGTLKGQTTQSPQGITIDQFLGVPYGAPPVGDLRYADPQPLEALPNDPYEATSYKGSCLQHIENLYGSQRWNPPDSLQEDCLYMNIWVPRSKKAAERYMKDVIVLIYGSGFYRGSSDLPLFDGKTLAAETGAIVLSFNYRVGVLGFFSTGDGRVSGNFGLKDQALALGWIKEHIRAFGGNPNSITIIGDGAGAASVGYHLLSPQSRPLFNRAVFQSGSTISNWAFMTKKQASERAKQFLSYVGCETMPNRVELLGCLRNLSLSETLNNAWVTYQFMVFPWVPTIDGQFLMDNPYTLFQKGGLPKKDVMFGFNKDEGSFWTIGYQLPGFAIERLSLQTHAMFLESVNIMDWDLNNETRANITQQYLPRDPEDEVANRDAEIAIAGDRSFCCPVKQLADMLVKAGFRTYLYTLTYRASSEVWPKWMGVSTGSEVQWTLGLPLHTDLQYTDEERGFSRQIMGYIGEFAHTGNPNPPEQLDWLPYNPEKDGEDSAFYQEWKGPGEFETGQGIKTAQCNMWNQINDQYFTKIINKL